MVQSGLLQPYRHGLYRRSSDFEWNPHALSGLFHQLHLGALMNENHAGYLVLSPRFAQQLVQHLEHFNNVDQHTNDSNLALPFALLQVIQADPSSDSTIQSPAV